MSSNQYRVVDFPEVHQEEVARLKDRRKKANQNPGNPAQDAVGLALSGGGIRSATFNLGLLQALERHNVLGCIDYLSTVSGGGYIGSCLTWFQSKLRRPFPFGISRADYNQLGGKVLAWLRAHGTYLTPGDGLNIWALLAAILTGTLVSLTVLVPVFLLVVWGLLHYSIFVWLLAAGVGVLLLFLPSALVFALLTGLRAFRRVIWQRQLRKLGGILILVGVVLVLIGSIPHVYAFLALHLPGWIKSAISAISFSGLVAMYGALRGRQGGNEAKGVRSFFLSVGLALATYGLFLGFYHLMKDYPAAVPFWLWWALGASVLLALVANINHASLHRFYRNRLMEAYLPNEKDLGITSNGVNAKTADQCKLHEIPQTAAPYHLINTNIQTVGSDKPKLQERGGDSFLFSPLYSGATSTGYVKTSDYVGGSMNLATAFAISGAAVDPNTYATRSRPLSFLMTLFNVRLGYWIRNPRNPARWLRSWSRPKWYYYMFIEMLGRGLDETRWHVHLSDGGHFENLGLYELIRRRCRFIIVSDASADPHWNFADLERAVERVRVDFGARIEIDITPLLPEGEGRISPSAFVAGEITYVDGDKADFVLVKTAFIKDLNADLYGYRKAHKAFPDESTVDQFFDEAQFEAYRELGYQVGKRLGELMTCDDLEGSIKCIRSSTSQQNVASQEKQRAQARTRARKGRSIDRPRMI